MDEITTAALIFTAAGALFVCLGVPLFLGRVRPNWWYGCRTEKTLSDKKVWYAVNRVTGRDIIAGGIALVAGSLALLIFGRGMNPDHAVLALLFILLLSVVMAVDSHRAQKRV
ncbi:MAG TPA: SdpI family protein [Pyrinomonadaceae bacterium]|nr:SdpI family protein [Pyrinomonadaceae bacterium]